MHAGHHPAGERSGHGDGGAGALHVADAGGAAQRHLRQRRGAHHRHHRGQGRDAARGAGQHARLDPVQPAPGPRHVLHRRGPAGQDGALQQLGVAGRVEPAAPRGHGPHHPRRHVPKLRRRQQRHRLGGAGHAGGGRGAGAGLLPLHRGGAHTGLLLLPHLPAQDAHGPVRGRR